MTTVKRITVDSRILNRIAMEGAARPLNDNRLLIRGNRKPWPSVIIPCVVAHIVASLWPVDARAASSTDLWMALPLRTDSLDVSGNGREGTNSGPVAISGGLATFNGGSIVLAKPIDDVTYTVEAWIRPARIDNLLSQSR